MSLYYRNASAAIIAYDITKMNSFNIAKAWVNKLQRQTGVVIALGQFPMNKPEKVYSDPKVRFLKNKKILAKIVSTRNLQNKVPPCFM